MPSKPEHATNLVLDFDDIDVASWRWGEAFSIGYCGTREQAVEAARENERPTYALCLPASGNPKYFGHHGAVNAAVVSVAAGIVEPDARIVTCLADGGGGNARELDDLVTGGVGLLHAPGDAGASPLLAPGELVLDTSTRPPEVALSGGNISDAGISRLLAAVATRTLAGIRRTFPYLDGDVYLDENVFTLFELMTLGHFRGWWDEPAYSGLGLSGGFGSNWLAGADLSDHPFFADGKLTPQQAGRVGEDIGAIWMRFYSGCGQKPSRLFVDDPGCYAGLGEMADELGMATMFDAYFAGVPLADLIA